MKNIADCFEDARMEKDFGIWDGAELSLASGNQTSKKLKVMTP